MNGTEIFGYSWERIQRAQQGGRLNEQVRLSAGADYGSDPVGDGEHVRLIPSGRIVTVEEAASILAARLAP